jgi:ABC-type phosphate/phosphonate transport system permease subunit
LLKLRQQPELLLALFPEMVPPKVIALFELSALYVMVNLASDQNIYIAEVMVAMVDTVVMGTSIKVAAAKMATWLLAFIDKCGVSSTWCLKVDSIIYIKCSLFCRH